MNLAPYEVKGRLFLKIESKMHGPMRECFGEGNMIATFWQNPQTLPPTLPYRQIGFSSVNGASGLISWYAGGSVWASIDAGGAGESVAVESDSLTGVLKEFKLVMGRIVSEIEDTLLEAWQQWLDDPLSENFQDVRQLREVLARVSLANTA